jgi:hypothetical protein
MNCPFCAEEVQDGAAKCRYCREWITPTANHESALAQGGSMNVGKAGWDPSKSPTLWDLTQTPNAAGTLSPSGSSVVRPPVSSEDSPSSAALNRIPKSAEVATSGSSLADHVSSATVASQSHPDPWRAGCLKAWFCFGAVAALVAAIQRGPEAAIIKATVFGCWTGVFALLLALGDFAYKFLPPWAKSLKARLVIYLSIAGLILSVGLLRQSHAGRGTSADRDPSPQKLDAESHSPDRKPGGLDAFIDALKEESKRADDAVKDWYLYKSPDGTFEVKLPEEPKITQNPGTLMLHSQGELGKVGILRKENTLGTVFASSKLSDGLQSNLRGGGYNILEAHNTQDLSFVTALNGELRIEIKALSTPSFVYQLIITEPASRPTERFQDERRGCFGSLKVHL